MYASWNQPQDLQLAVGPINSSYAWLLHRAGAFLDIFMDNFLPDVQVLYTSMYSYRYPCRVVQIAISCDLHFVKTLQFP